MNSLKTQGKQSIYNREGRARGGRGKTVTREPRKRDLQHEGNGIGERLH